MSTITASTRHPKPYGGMQMEGPIARWYAHITRARRDHRPTALAIAAQLPSGGAVLEVAPGPGYMAIELAKLGAYHITGPGHQPFIRAHRNRERPSGGGRDRLPTRRCGAHAVRGRVVRLRDLHAPPSRTSRIPWPPSTKCTACSGPGGHAVDLRHAQGCAPRGDRPGGARHAAVPPSAFVTTWIFRLGLLRAAYTREALDGGRAQPIRARRDPPKASVSGPRLIKPDPAH